MFILHVTNKSINLCIAYKHYNGTVVNHNAHTFFFNIEIILK